MPQRRLQTVPADQPGRATDTNGFRIGEDGNTAPLQAATPTLPQPLYPGYNGGAASAAEGLDPHFRPNSVDSFDLTIQRQIKGHNLIEVGYIGRLIHNEYQPYNLNAVPYMMAQGGQSFCPSLRGARNRARVRNFCGSVRRKRHSRSWRAALL